VSSDGIRVYNRVLPQRRDLGGRAIVKRENATFARILIGDSTCASSTVAFNKWSANVHHVHFDQINEAGLITRYSRPRFFKKKAAPDTKICDSVQRGLHDIAQPAVGYWTFDRDVHTRFYFPGGEHYRQSLIQLVDLIRSFLPSWLFSKQPCIRVGQVTYSAVLPASALPLDKVFCAYFQRDCMVRNERVRHLNLMHTG
jgi:hypothetical protein